MVWREFGDRIARGDFDVVHRITPLSPTTPSRIAKRCKKAGVPFVVGPLNGSVPWPKTLRAAQHREGEFLSYVRSAYKLLPGYRGTRESPSAPFLKAGKMRLDIIGDGSEMERLRGLVDELEVESSVELPGWIKHEEVQDRLVRSGSLRFQACGSSGGSPWRRWHSEWCRSYSTMPDQASW
jgi:hypothetical protein